MAEAYRLNELQVACEFLEDDLILLHFESGFYYNVRGTGAAICQHLLAGGTIGAAISCLEAHYGPTAQDVEREVRAFVDELVKEGLLLAADASSDAPPMPTPVGGYEPPRCEKFDDMADQLLLDKIDDLAQDAEWAGQPSAPPQ